MTDLRTAAQQALEACKLIVSAFDALKPASAARNEPLQINAARASITALEAALAGPVQEPVAWMYTGVKSDGSEHGPHLVWRPEYMDAMSASKGTKATPLYTSPPQREPLTDEQISDLWHQSGEQPFKFARMLLK